MHASAPALITFTAITPAGAFASVTTTATTTTTTTTVGGSETARA